MLKKSIFFFIASLVGTAMGGTLPLSFTAQPTFPETVTPSGTATLSYTLQNNTKQALSLVFLNSITAGTLTDNAAGTTCGSSLSASGSCIENFAFTAPASGVATGFIEVTYNGQYSLMDSSLSFSISSGGGGTATIIISPSTTGMATTSTQQFTATEVEADGTVNTNPSVSWAVSGSSGVATINASSGLATSGGSDGNVTVTATDSSNNASGTATLTTLTIGEPHGSGANQGYVYCMGTGNTSTTGTFDNSKCAYLPSGYLGGVIDTSDSLSDAIPWQPTSSNTLIGASSYVNGSLNTAIINAAFSDFSTTTTAANYCTALSSSWYLPAIGELNVIFKNITALESNTTFQTMQNYWSSTETDAYDALIEYFGGGQQNSSGKDGGSGNYVRCVQTFNS